MHPRYFEQNFPPQTETRQINSNGIARELPIDLINDPQKGYNLYSKGSGKGYQDSYMDVMIRGIHECNPLAKKFSSIENIQHLQRRIKYSVFVNSGGKITNGRPMKGNGHLIGNQSIDEMVIIMRYIYLQYGNHANNVDFEVNKLNNLFIKEATPNIIEQVESHLGYLRDASRLPEPIPLPLSTSNAGLKKYRSTTQVLGVEET